MTLVRTYDTMTFFTWILTCPTLPKACGAGVQKWAPLVAIEASFMKSITLKRMMGTVPTSTMEGTCVMTYSTDGLSFYFVNVVRSL